jgi:uncharacterized membrane protein YhaH (DUF805 family)
MLRRKDFWIGVLLGYAVVVVFPQVNIRSKAVKFGA